MTESMPGVVLEAADIVAVSQLVLRERFGRDLGLWEQMRDRNHDDSFMRISWMKGSGSKQHIVIVGGGSAGCGARRKRCSYPRRCGKPS